MSRFSKTLVALLVAVLNIKDYFWFKAGPSLTIPDAAKPGLFKRMREVVTEGNMGPMLVGTVLLAIVANSYERTSRSMPAGSPAGSARPCACVANS